MWKQLAFKSVLEEEEWFQKDLVVWKHVTARNNNNELLYSFRRT